jgi:hypothetical protein
VERENRAEEEVRVVRDRAEEWGEIRAEEGRVVPSVREREQNVRGQDSERETRTEPSRREKRTE